MVTAPSQLVTCGYCGIEFEEDRGQPTCKNCPLARGCSAVRCPNCGYENPVVPAWVQRLRQWVSNHEPD
jgi:hypothetical protein